MLMALLSPMLMSIAVPARPSRIRFSPVKAGLIAMLGTVPSEPTDEDLRPVVEALVEHADSAPTRKMGSAQAMLREHGSRLATDVRERIVALTQAELARREQDRPAMQRNDPAVSGGTWYSIELAAPRLGIQEDVLAKRLHHHEHRRRFGYPRWDGYRWMFSSLMVDPATSAAYLASMPAHEGVPELLPDWCIREGQTRAPRDAKTEEERLALRWPLLP